jgi:hypothetical protein
MPPHNLQRPPKANPRLRQRQRELLPHFTQRTLRQRHGSIPVPKEVCRAIAVCKDVAGLIVLAGLKDENFRSYEDAGGAVKGIMSYKDAVEGVGK